MSSKDLLQGYGGENVIILGEVHKENSHRELEEEAIYRSLPRYVLSEALDDTEREDFDEIIDGADLMSLRDVSSYFSEAYDDPTFLDQTTKELYEEIQDVEESDSIFTDSGEIPGSYSHFMDMPFFRMNNKVRDKIVESLESRRKRELDEWEKWMAEDNETGVYGDEKTYAMLDIAGRIRKIGRMSGSTPPLVRALNDVRDEGFEADLAGCDVNKSEKYSDERDRNFHMDVSVEQMRKQHEEMEENPEKVLEDMGKDLEMLSQATDDEELEKRDQKMAERITEFDRKNESERPVLAVIGANHLEGVSEKLEKQGIPTYSQPLEEVKEAETGDLDGLYHAFETAHSLR